MKGLLYLGEKLISSGFIKGNFLSLFCIKVNYYIKEFFLLRFKCFDHAFVGDLQLIDLFVAHIAKFTIGRI